MTIPNITEDDIKSILTQNLTPSDTIRTRDRLFGRDKTLRIIERALNSAGRQIFVYGDRGIGKTSLARISAYLHTGAENDPIYVMCGTTNSFSQVLQSIGNAVIPIRDRFEGGKSGGSVSVNLPGGLGLGVANGAKGIPSVPEPKSLADALDIIRYVGAKRGNTTIVIVDELERIESAAERAKFAEFIRNLPELDCDVRFIFCGIMHDIAELVQAHRSAGRILETINLERLNHSDLWKIITGVAEKLNVEIQREALIRISQISDGFPHYVHLTGECLFWSMFDDPNPVTASSPLHFKSAIEDALKRTEGPLRVQYDKATKKTRNTEEYEEALWALADSTADSRQISDIYSASYCWINAKLPDRSKMTREELNQRYLSLRKGSHDRIVVGMGSGWFAFRENIMRGYVRLRAEAQGINLGRHHSTAGMD